MKARTSTAARPWVRRGLTLLVIGCALAALVKLRPEWRDFDTAAVRLVFPAGADSAGDRLDGVLLGNLAHFGYLRAFDHVFAAGSRRYRIERAVWLDRCEVRQGDFYKFAQWLPFNPQASAPAPDQPANWRHFSDTREHAVSGRLDAPASGLTWFDAYAYCQAAGGRLPRAPEWIAAAAGRQPRLYPWGDVFDPRPWPYLDPLLNAARTCGALADTTTPEGFADMGQNVSEWAVGEWHPGAAVVMGGNAYNAPREIFSLAVLYRRAPPKHRSAYLGFRCAYDAPPAATPWRTEPNAAELPAGDYSVGIPEGARVPGLLAHLPRDRLPLIERIFARDDGREVVDLHLTVREITRREYAAFLRDPFVAAGFHAEDNQPRRHSHRPPDWEEQIKQPELPVVNVDWWSAYAFASWAGGRLPSAEEWEAAASGQGRRLYPWGDDFAAATPVTAERQARGPQVVSAAQGDVTPDGLAGPGRQCLGMDAQRIRRLRELRRHRQGRQLPAAGRRDCPHGLQKPPIAESPVAGLGVSGRLRPAPLVVAARM